jgi:hypothetical protein
MTRDRTSAPGATDIRFTATGDVFCASGAQVQSVDLLGSDRKLEFEQRAHGLHMQQPAQSVFTCLV